jgi:hypothetical protein
MLMIRRKTGVERLRCYLTGLRQYRCSDCDQQFRAPDRRLTPRDAARDALHGGVQRQGVQRHVA